MIFRPALITDLDAVERHYTELLTHEAETGRSSTNWSLGVYPTRQTAAAAQAAGEPLDTKPVSMAIDEVYDGRLQVVHKE